jgi:hypothetical protein
MDSTTEKDNTEHTTKSDSRLAIEVYKKTITEQFYQQTSRKSGLAEEEGMSPRDSTNLI